MKSSQSHVAQVEARLARARADLKRVTAARASRATIDAAAARFHEARRAMREALGAPTSRLSDASLPSTLTGHLFSSAGSAAKRLALQRSNRSVAVCLSGGGSRAASCSMGALRGLRALGLLDDVQYLSTVSGGGWAGSIYMYAPYSDDELLGPVLPDADVANLDWDSGDAPYNLSTLGDHAIGQFCTQIGWESLIEGATELWYDHGSTLSSHAYWPRLIGSQVLGPYGLGDQVDSNGLPTKYYTLDPGWYGVTIGKHNPDLSQSSFYLANQHRPFWVANSTFNAPGDAPSPYPFWQTQFDVGIYPRFPGQGLDGGDLGGGGIDPFTFESAAPTSANEGFFTVDTPQGQYALSDPVGSSSAAFGVELFSRLPDDLKHAIGDLTPEYAYWPVMTPSQGAETYQISDGAGLDNSAICGLLGWSGANSIISFVNTDVPITIEDSLSISDLDSVQMDSSIPALFGWIWDPDLGGYRGVTSSDGNAQYVQVFDPGDFVQLVAGLRTSIGGGGAAAARVNAKTVANARFGVAAGQAVSVLFFFNYQATNFWSQIRTTIRLGLDFHYPAVTFPYFGTITDLNLRPQAVNLLADLMSWSVTTNASLVRSMFNTIT